MIKPLFWTEWEREDYERRKRGEPELGPLGGRRKHICPICGDPNIFALWVDPEPPAGCSQDMENWGTPRAVKNVTECKWQMGKAWQAAEFRKLVPDAFDDTGKMKPGQLARVLEVFGKAHPDKAIVL